MYYSMASISITWRTARRMRRSNRYGTALVLPIVWMLVTERRKLDAFLHLLARTRASKLRNTIHLIKGKGLENHQSRRESMVLLRTEDCWSSKTTKRRLLFIIFRLWTHIWKEQKLKLVDPSICILAKPLISIIKSPGKKKKKAKINKKKEHEQSPPN